MENQPTTLDKVVKVSIIAGALIMALSVAYYFIYYLPRKQARIESGRKECATTAMDKAKERFNKSITYTADGKKFVPISNARTGEHYDGYYKTDYDKYFGVCLQEKGITN